MPTDDDRQALAWAAMVDDLKRAGIITPLQATIAHNRIEQWESYRRSLVK